MDFISGNETGLSNGGAFKVVTAKIKFWSLTLPAFFIEPAQNMGLKT